MFKGSSLGNLQGEMKNASLYILTPTPDYSAEHWGDRQNICTNSGNSYVMQRMTQYTKNMRYQYGNTKGPYIYPPGKVSP